MHQGFRGAGHFVFAALLLASSGYCGNALAGNLKEQIDELVEGKEARDEGRAQEARAREAYRKKQESLDDEQERLDKERESLDSEQERLGNSKRSLDRDSADIESSQANYRANCNRTFDANSSYEMYLYNQCESQRRSIRDDIDTYNRNVTSRNSWRREFRERVDAYNRDLDALKEKMSQTDDSEKPEGAFAASWINDYNTLVNSPAFRKLARKKHLEDTCVELSDTLEGRELDQALITADDCLDQARGKGR